MPGYQSRRGTCGVGEKRPCNVRSTTRTRTEAGHSAGEGIGGILSASASDSTAKCRPCRPRRTKSANKHSALISGSSYDCRAKGCRFWGRKPDVQNPCRGHAGGSASACNRGQDVRLSQHALDARTHRELESIPRGEPWFKPWARLRSSSRTSCW